jgi:hypothetical protein
MKTALVIALLLLGGSKLATAAEILTDPTDAGSTRVTWDDRYPYSFTQNADPEAFNAGVYTCGDTISNYITDSWAMRRFYFADEGISVAFTVQSIDWGVRRFVALGDSVPGPYAITLYVGKIAVGLPLVFANIDWVNSVQIPITTADNPPPGGAGVPKHTPITALITDTVNHDLVVAFFAPSTYGLRPRVSFSEAASNLGELYESYYAFADCEFPEPVTPTELGGPGQSQLALIVNGDVWDPPVEGACCLEFAPPNCVMMLESDCYAQGGLWFGGPCDPSPCINDPVEETSWGRIKARWR